MTHQQRSTEETQLIWERAKLSSGLRGKATRPNISAWSSHSCEDHALKYKIDKDLTSYAEQRAVMIRFINFYLGGTVPPGFNAKAIITCMSLLIADPETLIASQLCWPSKFYQSDLNNDGPLHTPKKTVAGGSVSDKDPVGESLSVLENPSPMMKISAPLESTSAAAPPSFTAPPTFNNTGINQSTTTSVAPITVLIKSYTAEDQRAFRNTCASILGSTSATSTPGESFFLLRRLANFLALTMLRFSVKDKAQMAQAFSKNQYYSNISHLIFGDEESYYAPPCESALNKAALAMDKRNKETSSLVAKMVMAWVHESTMGSEDIAAILAASFLTHTSYNGMGILEMISQIHEEFEVDWQTLARHTMTTITRKSWLQISKFFVDYLPDEGEIDATHPWARVIHDGYFTEFKTIKHATLASMLAPVIKECQGGSEGIYEANWAIRRKAIVDDLRVYGEALLKVLSPSVDTTEGDTEETRALLREARAARKKNGMPRDVRGHSGVGATASDFE